MNALSKNYIFSVLYQLLNIILPLITMPYVSRVLGVSGVGHNSYVASIVNYYSLFVILGTYTYGQREIGANQNNKNKYTEIFWNLLLFKFILGGSVLIIYIVTVPFYDNALRLLFFVRVLTLIGNMLDISWFFQGMENFKVTVTRQMVIRVLGALSIFVWVNDVTDLVLYAFIDAFLLFAGNISLYPFLKQYIDKTNVFTVIKSSVVKVDIIPYIKGSLALFIPQMATSLYMSIDKSMIGHFFKDGIEGGYYEQATKIHMMGISVVIALTNVLIPRLSLYYNESKEEEMADCADKAISYIFFVGAPLACGISAIGYNFLPWFLGNEYTGTCDVLQITALLIFVMGLTNFMGYGYLVATHQQKMYTFSVVLGTIINIIFNCFMIPQYGAVGAAIASVASEICVLVFQVMLVQRQIPIWNMLLHNVKYVLFALLMYLITLNLSKTLTPNVYNTIFVVLIGVLVYVMLLIVTKDKYLSFIKLRKIKAK